MRRLLSASASAIALSLILAGAALADVPKARIQGVEDRVLRNLIEDAVGKVEEEPTSRVDARRRATEAASMAYAVLRSEGYYQAEVEPTVSDTDPPQAILKIRPGERFTFGEAQVLWVGTAPSTTAQGAAFEAMEIEAGQPGRAAVVLGAEGRIIASVQQEGYPDAVARTRDVVVDHATTTVLPTFNIEAGDLVRMDGVVVITQGRTKPRYVERLAPWTPGDTFDPDDVAELERRLQDVGVYDSVTVALAPKDQTTADGLRPVIVSIADRPPRTLELGAGYSTTEGIGIDARWLNYNRLGRFDTITLVAKIGSIQQKLDLELSLPHWRKPDQRLRIGGGFIGDRTDAFDDYGAGVRTDVEWRFRRTSYVTTGLSLDYISTFDKTVTTPAWQNLFIGTVLGAFALDRSDDVLDPRRGWRVEARVEPTGITGDVTLAYLKAQIQGSYYWPVSEGTVLAFRGRVGTIAGGKIPDVPISRRFFAGGGGSVRGFSYQGVGPRLSNNTPQGGLSLVEVSAEVRRQITGPWSAVAFVDAGSVGLNTAPDFNDLSVGVGLGVRYDLGFGPIRFDIAAPLNRRTGDPAFQIYISIGQAF